MHISELAPHHVESPREIVHPGDEIRVKILEIDSERRRLSLSAKRVEDQILPVSRPGRAREPPAADARTTPQDDAPTLRSRPRPPRSQRRSGASRRPQRPCDVAEAGRGGCGVAEAAEEAEDVAEAVRGCRGRGGRGGGGGVRGVRGRG